MNVVVSEIYTCPLCGRVYDRREEAEKCLSFHIPVEKGKIDHATYTPGNDIPRSIYVDFGGSDLYVYALNGVRRKDEDDYEH